MATTYTISCTKCGKKMSIGEQIIGKKIRCKECQTVFTAEKPGGPAKKAAKKEEAPQQQLSAKDAFAKQLADEEAQGDNPYGLGEFQEGVARCPRCAQEMESEEAVICLNCGFNVKTRERVESKAVYEQSGGEVFKHRLPGIICAILCVGTFVFMIVFNFKVQQWSLNWEWLQNEDKTFWLKPGIFGLYGSLAMFGFIILPCGRFAYKRLVIDHRPEEKEIK